MKTLILLNIYQHLRQKYIRNVYFSIFFLFLLYGPSCALQLSMVLSRFSWKRLLICLFGDVRTGAVPCFCWTVSLSSFRSISALLRSGRIQRKIIPNSNMCTWERSYLFTYYIYSFSENHIQWCYICSQRIDIIKHLHAYYILGIKDSPRLRFRMLPVCGVFSCLEMPGAWEWNGLGLSNELPAGPGRGWEGDAVQRYLLLIKVVSH